jgi:LPXTG-motif cell wall-anchored protein
VPRRGVLAEGLRDPTIPEKTTDTTQTTRTTGTTQTTQTTQTTRTTLVEHPGIERLAYTGGDNTPYLVAGAIIALFGALVLLRKRGDADRS